MDGWQRLSDLGKGHGSGVLPGISDNASGLQPGSASEKPTSPDTSLSARPLRRHLRGERPAAPSFPAIR